MSKHRSLSKRCKRLGLFVCAWVALLLLGGGLCMSEALATDKPPDSSGEVELPKPDFGPYMAMIQRKIKRRWFPPKGNESKRVTVRYKIARDGKVSDLRLAKSSGVAPADKAALKAVEEASPLPPLPAGAPASVDIEFTFDYNVFDVAKKKHIASNSGGSKSSAERGGGGVASTRTTKSSLSSSDASTTSSQSDDDDKNRDELAKKADADMKKTTAEFDKAVSNPIVIAMIIGIPSIALAFIVVIVVMALKASAKFES